jgi:hypothetical protein
VETHKGIDFYSYWSADPYRHKPLLEEGFRGRKGKLLIDDFKYILVNGSDVTDEKHRSYKAVASNCQSIWLHVRETDESIRKDLDPVNHVAPGDIDWGRAAESFGIVFDSDLDRATRYIGKDIYNTPLPTGAKLYGRRIPNHNMEAFGDFEVLKLLSVKPQPFTTKGYTHGAFTLVVQTSRGKFLIPWVSERLRYRNPFTNKQIRPFHRADIRAKRLRFGMNTSEIALAWGVPENVRYFDQRHDTRGFLTDKEALEYRQSGKKMSFVEAWFYPSRMHDGEYLVLSENGLLQQSLQLPVTIERKVTDRLIHPAARESSAVRKGKK